MGGFAWSCSSCTFQHHAPASRCQMCGELRVTREQMREFVTGGRAAMNNSGGQQQQGQRSGGAGNTNASGSGRNGPSASATPAAAARASAPMNPAASASRPQNNSFHYRNTNTNSNSNSNIGASRGSNSNAGNNRSAPQHHPQQPRQQNQQQQPQPQQRTSNAPSSRPTGQLLAFANPYVRKRPNASGDSSATRNATNNVAVNMQRNAQQTMQQSGQGSNSNGQNRPGASGGGGSAASMARQPQQQSSVRPYPQPNQQQQVYHQQQSQQQQQSRAAAHPGNPYGRPNSSGFGMGGGGDGIGNSNMGGEVDSSANVRSLAGSAAAAAGAAARDRIGDGIRNEIGNGRGVRGGGNGTSNAMETIDLTEEPLPVSARPQPQPQQYQQNQQQPQQYQENRQQPQQHQENQQRSQHQKRSQHHQSHPEPQRQLNILSVSRPQPSGPPNSSGVATVSRTASAYTNTAGDSGVTAPMQNNPYARQQQPRQPQRPLQMQQQSQQNRMAAGASNTGSGDPSMAANNPNNPYAQRKPPPKYSQQEMKQAQLRRRAKHTAGASQQQQQQDQSNPFAIAKSNKELQEQYKYAPGPVPLDMEAAKTWIYPEHEKYPTRDYQVSISQTAILHNTLVSLPTGLGKTLIAAVVMYNYYRWFPEGKVVFCAPTRPLVTQQIKACYDIMGIPEAHTAEMSGNTLPASRAEHWIRRRAFFCTPQTLQNDIDANRCAAKSIVCIVLDEAHKAQGDYAYTKVIEQIEASGAKFRVVGLSATPGAKIDLVNDVIQNLRISKIEAKTDEDANVKQYINERKEEFVIIQKGDAFKNVGRLLDKVIRPKIEVLREKGALRNVGGDNPAHYKLIEARREYQAANGYGLGAQFNIVTTLVMAKEQLGITNINITKAKLEKMKRQGGQMKAVTESEDFKELWKEIDEATRGQPDEYNPKLAKLKEVLTEHFNRAKASGESSRAIVFSSRRESVREIVKILKSKEPLIRPQQFVGQSKAAAGKKSGGTNDDGDDAGDDDEEELKGMKQAEQQEAISKFRRGDVNVIVATSIGEEGLDVGECDLIVNYDSLRSPIRMIQRVGRTGRKRDGRVVSLVAEGQEKRKYESSKSDQARLFRVLKEKNNAFFKFVRGQAMFPEAPKQHKKIMDIQNEYRMSQVGGHSGKKKKRKDLDNGPGFDKTKWRLRGSQEEQRRERFGSFTPTDRYGCDTVSSRRVEFPAKLRREYLRKHASRVSTTTASGTSSAILSKIEDLYLDTKSRRKKTLLTSRVRTEKEQRQRQNSSNRGRSPNANRCIDASPARVDLDTRLRAAGEDDKQNDFLPEDDLWNDDDGYDDDFQAYDLSDGFDPEAKHQARCDEPVVVDIGDSDDSIEAVPGTTDTTGDVNNDNDAHLDDVFGPMKSMSISDGASQRLSRERLDAIFGASKEKECSMLPPPQLDEITGMYFMEEYMSEEESYEDKKEEAVAVADCAVEQPRQRMESPRATEVENIMPPQKELSTLASGDDVHLSDLTKDDDIMDEAEDADVPIPARQEDQVEADVEMDQASDRSEIQISIKGISSSSDDSEESSGAEDDGGSVGEHRTEKALSIEDSMPARHHDAPRCVGAEGEAAQSEDGSEPIAINLDLLRNQGVEADAPPESIQVVLPTQESLSDDDTSSSDEKESDNSDDDESANANPANGSGAASEAEAATREGGDERVSPTSIAAASDPEFPSQMSQQSGTSTSGSPLCTQGQNEPMQQNQTTFSASESNSRNIDLVSRNIDLVSMMPPPPPRRPESTATTESSQKDAPSSNSTSMSDSESTSMVFRRTKPSVSRRNVLFSPTSTQEQSVTSSTAGTQDRKPAAGTPLQEESASAMLLDTPDKAMEDDTADGHSRKRRLKKKSDTVKAATVATDAEPTNGEPRKKLKGSPEAIARKERVSGKEKLRDRVNRFFDTEAGLDGSDNEGDSAEEAECRAIEEDEMSHDSFINDSSQLGSCSQDALDVLDERANDCKPSRRDANDVTTHRELDIMREREREFATPVLNRRNRNGRRKTQSTPLSTGTQSSAERGLGNMAFIRSVIEHHKKGGNADEIEDEYHRLEREDGEAKTSEFVDLTQDDARGKTATTSPATSSRSQQATSVTHVPTAEISLTTNNSHPHPLQREAVGSASTTLNAMTTSQGASAQRPAQPQPPVKATRRQQPQPNANSRDPWVEHNNAIRKQPGIPIVQHNGQPQGATMGKAQPPRVYPRPTSAATAARPPSRGGGLTAEQKAMIERKRQEALRRKQQRQQQQQQQQRR